jgi:hypothetical protein
MNASGDRLFVAVVGARNSGKSTTWNTLFGRQVNTGKKPRRLDLLPPERTIVSLVDKSVSPQPAVGRSLPSRPYLDVFLVSGSNEEKKRYAQKVLEDVDCSIVLCSVQYNAEAFERTWNFVFEQGFQVYVQWLNPGYRADESYDHLGLVNHLLSKRALVSMRDGRENLSERTEEIRQFIYGWAAARGLVGSSAQTLSDYIPASLE